VIVVSDTTAITSREYLLTAPEARANFYLADDERSEGSQSYSTPADKSPPNGFHAALTIVTYRIL